MICHIDLYAEAKNRRLAVLLFLRIDKLSAGFSTVKGGLVFSARLCQGKREAEDSSCSDLLTGYSHGLRDTSGKARLGLDIESRPASRSVSLV